MNSQNQRLETIKPAVASDTSGPHAAVVTQHSFEIHARQTKSRRSLYRRKRRRGPNDEYQVQESQADIKPKSWLSQLLSGWMFSLLVHCLLLLWLGNLITNIKTDGPLTLNFSAVSDDINDISVDISSVDLEAVFDDAASGGALDSEIVEPDPAPDLEDELQPDIAESITEPILEDLLVEAASDSSMFEPVNLGMVGLDEGEGSENGRVKGKGKGKGTGVKFFGVESEGNKFVFVVDCSGSMADERRYQRAVYELTRSMDMLETHHRFLVILYNSETYPMLGMTEQNIRLLPATRKNKKRVEKWLEYQQPDALTMPMFAMKTSLSLMPSSIYFLSDGEFHDFTIPMLDKLNVDDSSTGKTKIPINTITLGSTGIGAPMMKYIADESGGRFRWVR